MRQAADHSGIPWERYRAIGVLELAGAAGVLAGFALTALGAAGRDRVALLMAARLATDRRLGDPRAQMAPAALLGVLAVNPVLYLAH